MRPFDRPNRLRPNRLGWRDPLVPPPLINTAHLAVDNRHALTHARSKRERSSGDPSSIIRADVRGSTTPILTHPRYSTRQGPENHSASTTAAPCGRRRRRLPLLVAPPPARRCVYPATTKGQRAAGSPATPARHHAVVVRAHSSSRGLCRRRGRAAVGCGARGVGRAAGAGGRGGARDPQAALHLWVRAPRLLPRPIATMLLVSFTRPLFPIRHRYGSLMFKPEESFADCERIDGKVFGWRRVWAQRSCDHR